ncbi:hypothetical protein [Oligoflexus tunisiensis]|uniref:hypothetical protein n=1 Tax=Oligoflexus tunisiensis TaxID=708132 RepID=UPI00159F2AFF|nr:hypothetical protein [Oligoflexus tunisiensis]
MKYFLTIFLMLFAAKSFAGTYQEICYSDSDFCAKIVDHNGFLAQIVVTKDDYDTLDPALVREFQSAGVIFQAVTNERYNALPAPTIHRESASADADLIDGMSDEEFDVTMNTLSCLGAAFGCASGIAGSISTGGAALFFAGLSCGLAPTSCLQARRSYIKWKRWQEKKQKESREKQGTSEGGGATGGGGGSGGASTGGGQGGWYGPGGSVPSGGGTVTVSEAPPGPMPGSGGTSIGRRPILH